MLHTYMQTYMIMNTSGTILNMWIIAVQGNHNVTLKITTQDTYYQCDKSVSLITNRFLSDESNSYHYIQKMEYQKLKVWVWAK